MNARAIAHGGIHAPHRPWAVGEWFAQAIARARRRIRLDRDRRHLRALPDYILKDIGISRLEIEYATAHGRRPRGRRGDGRWSE
jgi:uncharacterized protein YjiS (DUF1127 family)